MPITRREFIVGLGATTGISFMSPIVVRAAEGFGQTLASGGPIRNKVVVIFQGGGNDGLNTVVPRGGTRYDVYRKVRPDLSYDLNATAGTALNRSGDAGWELGLNPRLATLYGLYQQDRVAIVQGVDYPNHSYSHFASTDIWESGQPSFPQSGWLGRFLDRVMATRPEGSLPGLGVGRELPLILRGERKRGVQVSSVQETQFADGGGPPGKARHDAFAKYGDAFDPAADPLRHFVGQQAAGAVALVNTLQTVPVPPKTANSLANSLLTARALLAHESLGIECVWVQQGGYDTHTTQKTAHENLLGTLDGALEAFFKGTLAGKALGGVGPLPKALADRTIVMTTSEFGRRIGQNGTQTVAGTDHGASAPLFMIGPETGATAAGMRLVPGIHGDHPPMGTTLAPAPNLAMTTELRRIYQAVLTYWLGDPDPSYDKSSATQPLAGLFSAV